MLSAHSNRARCDAGVNLFTLPLRAPRLAASCELNGLKWRHYSEVSKGSVIPYLLIRG